MFGFAFKKDTGDTRESAAIDVAKHLLDEGASLSIYDPKVPSDQIQCDLGCNFLVENPQDGVGAVTNGHDLHNNDKKVVRVKNCPYTTAKNAHAIVVCTEWDEFKDYGGINRTYGSYTLSPPINTLSGLVKSRMPSSA